MKFKIIKWHFLDETIFGESGLGVPFKFFYVRIEPDGLLKVEFNTDVGKGFEDLVGSGIIRIIFPEVVPDHSVFRKDLCPDSHLLLLDPFNTLENS